MGRSRPYTGEGAFEYRGWQFYKLESTSLPSGHATTAFAMSTVLSRQLRNTYATIGLYSVATLTSISRVYQDFHWISDTFLGAAIGTLVGEAVVRIHQGRNDRSALQLTPYPNGLRLELVF